MKKSIKRLISILVISLLFIGTVNVIAKQKYPDLNPTHWCYEKIMQFVDKGYIEGYQDGTMRPDRTITRAEYVKVVNNFFGFSKTETNKKFSDISDDAWYAEYVYTAVAQGYISGYEDNTFRPEKPITRQEATVILSRIIGIDDEIYPENHEDGLAQYSDGHEVADWAYTPIHSYSVYNFINGYEDGTLKILQNVTRAETVELLNILEQKIEIEKDNGGGGGSTMKRTVAPKVTAYELSADGKKEIPVIGWVNDKTKIQDGSKVVISGENDADTTLYFKLNDGDTNEYKKPFIVKDGKTTVTAWAKKTTRASSFKIKLEVLVDTVYPEVAGITDSGEKTVKILVNDVDKHNIGYISGINEESLEYAWFVEENNQYIRETKWNKFENGDIVEAPTVPGIYYLGVKGEDKAENKIGEKGKYGDFSYIDEYENVSGDEPTKDPYVIVTENEIENDMPSGDDTISGDDSTSGDNTPNEDIANPGNDPVKVEVEAEVKIIHIYDEDRENDVVYDLEVPGKEYTADVYEEAVNYNVIGDDDDRTIIVNRNSGDNVIEVKYDRKTVPVKYYFENVDNSKFTEDEKKEEKVKVPANMIVNAIIDEDKFEGFTFDSGNKENVVSGDISGDEDFETLKLYYKRNLYTITWVDDDDTPLYENDEKYGAKPKYKDGKETPKKQMTEKYYYEFDEWTPTVKVVTEDATYKATYEEQKRGIFKATITSNYDEAEIGEKAEPGTRVKYTISLTESGKHVDYSKPIEIKLDTSVSEPNNISGNGTWEYIKGEHKIIWHVTEDDDLKLNYDVKIGNIKAGSDIETTILSGATAKNHIAPVEISAKVMENAGKHIVLVLDKSGSMRWTMEQDDVYPDDLNDSRLKIMEKAANSFIKNVLSEKKEDIIISLVVFGTPKAEGNNYIWTSKVNPTATEVGNKLAESISDLAAIDKNNTFMQKALEDSINVFENDSGNMTRVLVFLSDGSSDDEIKADTVNKIGGNGENQLGATIFAIDFGKGSEEQTANLRAIAGENVFPARDEEALNTAFENVEAKMQEKDRVQSQKGNIILTEMSIVNNIIIMYNDGLKDNKIWVTEDNRAENYITIDGTTITWDISNYPESYTGFAIKVD